MFNGMGNSISSMEDAIERIQNASDGNAFKTAIGAVRAYMKDLGMDLPSLMELERRAYYLSNEYSQKDTREKIEDAKNRVIEYLLEMMDRCTGEKLLIQVLENFYLFLENLFEREPHKNGGIQKSQLECLKIKNEYDVQHLLYAYLKPLYPLARLEVNEDTGYGTVRADIFLDSGHVIEVKCTRSSMTLKKLVEEIEADMIHYGAQNICFFLYDREKIIENPLNFKMSYEAKMKEKKIHIIIHQSKIL